ncbi:hypothetical protein LJU32_07645 [Pseudomonas sp. B21_DOA]|nr:hypothetical protein LJU32_07645 [Pseudomonas sp. B21_DOA]
MNAHILAHAGSGMTMAYMQMIRLNYDCLLQVERRAIAAGIDMNDAGRLVAVIQNVVNEVLVQKKFPASTIHFAAGRLIEAIHSYYQDGIRVGARSTITLTGPGQRPPG